MGVEKEGRKEGRDLGGGMNAYLVWASSSSPSGGGRERDHTTGRERVIPCRVAFVAGGDVGGVFWVGSSRGREWGRATNFDAFEPFTLRT